MTSIGLPGETSARPTVSAGSRWVRVAVIMLALAPALFIATQLWQALESPASAQRPFTDALTYVAAGDRLNRGHDLYRLQADDLPVDLVPELYPVPMVGPPPAGVLFRPLAALEFGLAIWVAACWAALLGAVAYLVDRVGLLAIAASIALALCIGEQLAAGNIASFFPLLLIIAWRGRGGPVAGVAVGLMAAAKLSPIALTGWLIGIRNWRAVASVGLVLVVVFVACLLFAGWQNLIDYRLVLESVGPSPMSLSGLTGLPWASYAVLVLLTGAAILTGARPWLSFMLGILAMVFGTPALYGSGFVALLGLLAPIADTPELRRFRIPIGPRRA